MAKKTHESFPLKKWLTDCHDRHFCELFITNGNMLFRARYPGKLLHLTADRVVNFKGIQIMGVFFTAIKVSLIYLIIFFLCGGGSKICERREPTVLKGVKFHSQQPHGYGISC